jgi:hypothetical protein
MITPDISDSKRNWSIALRKHIVSGNPSADFAVILIDSGTRRKQSSSAAMVLQLVQNGTGYHTNNLLHKSAPTMCFT